MDASWLDGPQPAVLATYDADGTIRMTPVWYRRSRGAFAPREWGLAAIIPS